MEEKRASRFDLFIDAVLIGVGCSLWNATSALGDWSGLAQAVIAVGIAMNLFNGVERIVRAQFKKD